MSDERIVTFVNEARTPEERAIRKALAFPILYGPASGAASRGTSGGGVGMTQSNARRIKVVVTVTRTEFGIRCQWEPSVNINSDEGADLPIVLGDDRLTEVGSQITFEREIIVRRRNQP
jgi:hypothetical protein